MYSSLNITFIVIFIGVPVVIKEVIVLIIHILPRTPGIVKNTKSTVIVFLFIRIVFSMLAIPHEFSDLDYFWSKVIEIVFPTPVFISCTIIVGIVNSILCILACIGCTNSSVIA